MSEKTQQIATLEDFARRLTEEKGLNALDKDILDQVQKDLIDRIEDRINAAILAKMPEEKLDEFNGILDTKDSHSIQEFCAKNIPDLDALVGATLMDFRQIYLFS